MERLHLDNLTISYGGLDVIRELSLEVHDGEIVSLLGPSGAGKSTLLKTIAGLLPQKSGRVLIDGNCVDGMAAEKRDAVLIFQKPLLFPHLDVAGNIAFGLKMLGEKGRGVQGKIERILEITGLAGLESRRIHQLSGGQQQRVALARGLILEPSVLLLDEPLSSLDAELRQQMRELIREVQQQTGITMLFVTHDQSEAFAISDRVCVLLDGRLRQSGRPREMYYTPADLDVARFFGISNMMEGEVRGGRFRSGNIECDAAVGIEGQVTAVIRPEDIEIVVEHGENCMSGIVENVQFEGVTTRIRVKAPGNVYTLLAQRAQYRPGDEVALRFPPDRLHLIPSPAKKGETNGR